MTATLEARQSTKDRIAELMLEAESLKLSLPSPYLTFFRYRVVKPVRTFVLVYARDESESYEKVSRRLDSEYPDKWVLHPCVDTYHSPQEANGATSVGGNLFDSLTAEDRSLLLSHMDEANSLAVAPALKPGRKPGTRKPRKSSLVLAAEEYRRRLRAERQEVRQKRGTRDDE